MERRIAGTVPASVALPRAARHGRHLVRLPGAESPRGHPAGLPARCEGGDALGSRQCRASWHRPRPHCGWRWIRRWSSRRRDRSGAGLRGWSPPRSQLHAERSRAVQPRRGAVAGGGSCRAAYRRKVRRHQRPHRWPSAGDFPLSFHPHRAASEHCLPRHEG